MTPLTCSYTIAPLSDSVPVKCDRPAIRRVTFDKDEGSESLVMLYCWMHWNAVRDLRVVETAVVENLVEEEC
jgi:hypothetical protein